MGEFHQASLWSRTLVRQSPKPKGQALSDLKMAIACWAIINISLPNPCLCMRALHFSKTCTLIGPYESLWSVSLRLSSADIRTGWLTAGLSISSLCPDPDSTLAEKTLAPCWPGPQQCLIFSLNQVLTRAFLQPTDPIYQLLLNLVEETELPEDSSNCLCCEQRGVCVCV